MVAGLKSKEYKEKCSELGLETLEQRRMKQDMSLVHKLTREGQHFPYWSQSDIRKHSFAVRVVEGWNRLPDQVKMTASKDAFKRMLQNNDH